MCVMGASRRRDGLGIGCAYTPQRTFSEPVDPLRRQAQRTPCAYCPLRVKLLTSAASPPLGGPGLPGPDHPVELRRCLLGALNDRLQHTGNHLALLDRRDRVIVPVKAEQFDSGPLA